jgi:hypothetical protein
LDSSTNSDLEDNLEQESDNRLINSEILQEKQFEAEIERYDFLIAKAQAIVKRQRQEELEDNDMPMVKGRDGNSKGDSSSDSDSDKHSELLVLASSQFDSIDSIKYSNSIKLDSNSDDDSTSALGIAFSPQKTRSGKVVSYYSKE